MTALPLILKAIRSVEERFSVRAVYACESGSRAWGFESSDSDFDVRILYARPPHDYLRFVPLTDAFDYRFEEPEFKDLDVACWDIRKAAELLWRSNPPLIEWLGSPIVYEQHEGIASLLRECATTYFDRKKSAFHYVSMAKGVWHEIEPSSSETPKEVKRKKYLYALRPLACVRYLEKVGTVPPTRFESVLDGIEWDEPVRCAVDQLISEKKAGLELGVGPTDPVLHDFIRTELKAAISIAESLSPRQEVGQEKLDSLIWESIMGDWVASFSQST